jgi:hypothetical protein
MTREGSKQVDAQTSACVYAPDYQVNRCDREEADLGSQSRGGAE